MIKLQNDFLSIDILHPEQDSHLTGSRYCHGCSIWQIYNAQSQPLLSGPQYPSESPDTFDGQGMPEVFETALGSYPSSIGDNVLVVGVGEVMRSGENELFHTRWNPYIQKKCTWDIIVSKDHIQMSTLHSFRGYNLSLIKQLRLTNKTVLSATLLINHGPNPVSLKWFAHPFFPHNSDLSCCKLSLPVKIPDNPGFTTGEDSFIYMNNSFNWKNGCYRSLGIPWHLPLNILVNHPLEKHILIACRFAPTWLPIWANANTFSIEPSLARIIFPGSSANWEIEYCFNLKQTLDS